MKAWKQENLGLNLEARDDFAQLEVGAVKKNEAVASSRINSAGTWKLAGEL